MVRLGGSGFDCRPTPTRTAFRPAADLGNMPRKYKKSKKKEEDPFRMSATPPEWSDDPDREWPVDKIVDHCITPSGKFRYKIAWLNWARDSDGTNTTWQDEDTLEAHHIDAYWDAHKSLRDAYQLSQNISRLPTNDSKLPKNVYLEADVLTDKTAHVLAWRTIESKIDVQRKRGRKKTPRAEEESIRKRMEEVDKASRWAEETFGINPLFANLRGPATAGPSRSGSVIRNPLSPSPQAAEQAVQTQAENIEYINVDSPTPPDTTELDGALDRSSSTFPPVIDRFTDSSHHEGNGNRSDSDAEDNRLHPTLSKAEAEAEEEAQSRLHNPMTLFDLQPLWNAATDLAGAARVEIIYDRDLDGPDDIPPLPLDFKYIENSYIIPPSVWTSLGASLRAYITGCPCNGICDMEGSADCACQSHSAMDNQFAYDSRGVFLFNNLNEEGDNVEVFECTSACHCGMRCPNRTSQKPRDVLLEVFKTQKCGWGVRSTEVLPRGKVLGIFTGSLFS
ncbi:hypothetical protein FRB95_014416 [Tulasnella sp. JGI-2019a]|nr:hypothetical protein FRB95_014416 [Tulasnella sp. JGI-2019a]